MEEVEQEQQEQQQQHHLSPILLLLDRFVGGQCTNVLREGLCSRPVKTFVRNKYTGTVVPSSCEPIARVAQVLGGRCTVCCSTGMYSNGRIRDGDVGGGGCRCHPQKSYTDLDRHSSSS